MRYIDVHTHVSVFGFEKDLKQILEKAKQDGLLYVLDCGERYEENQKVLENIKKYDILKASLGFNPCTIDIESAEKVEEQIRENKDKIVAIGEVGLDYWKVKEEPDKEIQREIFRKFIKLSKELNLPLIIHSRSAGKVAIDFLLENGAERVCMHAFDGNYKSAEQGVEAGYFFSIPPSIVRSEQKQKLVQNLPLENMLLETDSPLLGPDREERNTPSNVIIACEKIAEIKGISLEEVAEVTTKDAKELFNL